LATSSFHGTPCLVPAEFTLEGGETRKGFITRLSHVAAALSSDPELPVGTQITIRFKRPADGQRLEVKAGIREHLAEGGLWRGRPAGLVQFHSPVELEEGEGAPTVEPLTAAPPADDVTPKQTAEDEEPPPRFDEDESVTDEVPSVPSLGTALRGAGLGKRRLSGRPISSTTPGARRSELSRGPESLTDRHTSVPPSKVEEVPDLDDAGDDFFGVSTDSVPEARPWLDEPETWSATGQPALQPDGPEALGADDELAAEDLPEAENMVQSLFRQPPPTDDDGEPVSLDEASVQAFLTADPDIQSESSLPPAELSDSEVDDAFMDQFGSVPAGAHVDVFAGLDEPTPAGDLKSLPPQFIAPASVPASGVPQRPGGRPSTDVDRTAPPQQDRPPWEEDVPEEELASLIPRNARIASTIDVTFWARGRRNEATADNFSREGLFLRYPGTPPVRGAIVRVEFPVQGSDESVSIRFNAEVRWHRSDRPGVGLADGFGVQILTFETPKDRGRYLELLDAILALGPAPSPEEGFSWANQGR